MSAFVTPLAVPLASSARLSMVSPLSGSLRSFARSARTVCIAPASLAPKLTMEMEMQDGPMDEPPALEETKLFVGNLSWDTTDESLGAAFSSYGTVVDSRVVIDRFTRKSRGFGFIQYETAASAEDALVGMNGVSVDGRNVRVDRANRRPPRQRRPQSDYDNSNNNYY
ncbi:Cold-inducible RNA-binding protein, putative [Chondrus crispus]|uniref:Cold-inducible RNA-binding protein, putative n=1 Tax=Chondrus crispus TaxID=2769 RepID=R7Q7V3_CHOCR|nr:Cold-inducible RNA-binding protein, putative [Chondrus crispus]CDF33535.1 Cold-inducible RNA-binding protein, putative [Chondrus crispus]|eukprot:XP_005713338.1 Cold-inducible RNA-binding protein, putative [Chondrus crispus]